jgi:hypothetical protein
VVLERTPQERERRDIFTAQGEADGRPEVQTESQRTLGEVEVLGMRYTSLGSKTTSEFLQVSDYRRCGIEENPML